MDTPEEQELGLELNRISDYEASQAVTQLHTLQFSSENIILTIKSHLSANESDYAGLIQIKPITTLGKVSIDKSVYSPGASHSKNDSGLPFLQTNSSSFSASTPLPTGTKTTLFQTPGAASQAGLSSTQNTDTPQQPVQFKGMFSPSQHPFSSASPSAIKPLKTETDEAKDIFQHVYQFVDDSHGSSVILGNVLDVSGRKTDSDRIFVTISKQVFFRKLYEKLKKRINTRFINVFCDNRNSWFDNAWQETFKDIQGIQSSYVSHIFFKSSSTGIVYKCDILVPTTELSERFIALEHSRTAKSFLLALTLFHRRSEMRYTTSETMRMKGGFY